MNVCIHFQQEPKERDQQKPVGKVHTYVTTYICHRGGVPQRKLGHTARVHVDMLGMAVCR